MLRNVALIVAFGAAVSGCGGSSITDQAGGVVGSDSTRSRGTDSTGAVGVSSVSPDYVFAVSPDITLTVTGSGFVRRSGVTTSAMFWKDATPTLLTTKVVSDTMLTAVVPADLLHDSGFAQVSVQVTSDVPLATSNGVGFSVLPRDTSFSVAPSTAAAGSSDLTITVKGTGFVDSDFLGSFVVWSENGTDTFLTTRFVSSSELAARIPAALMKEPLVGLVTVVTGYDPGDGLVGRRIGAADFTVTR